MTEIHAFNAPRQISYWKYRQYPTAGQVVSMSASPPFKMVAPPVVVTPIPTGFLPLILMWFAKACRPTGWRPVLRIKRGQLSIFHRDLIELFYVRTPRTDFTLRTNFKSEMHRPNHFRIPNWGFRGDSTAEFTSREPRRLGIPHLIDDSLTGRNMTRPAMDVAAVSCPSVLHRLL